MDEQHRFIFPVGSNFIWPPDVKNGPLPIRKLTRKRMAVLNLWGWFCIYCKNPLTVETMTFDHLIPKSKGGSHHTSNLVPACQRCNMLRGNFTTVESFDEVVKETRSIIAIAEKILALKIKPPKEKG